MWCALAAAACLPGARASACCPAARLLVTPALLVLLAAPQDCSIVASPITDTSCAEPGNKLDNSYTYANLQMRAYYQTTKKVRSLLPASGAGSSAYLMSLDPNGVDNQLAMRLFAATSTPSAASGATTVCNNANNVTGGSVAAVAPSTASACAAGSYYDAATMCPPWCAPCACLPACLSACSAACGLPCGVMPCSAAAVRLTVLPSATCRLAAALPAPSAVVVTALLPPRRRAMPTPTTSTWARSSLARAPPAPPAHPPTPPPPAPPTARS